MIKLVGGRKANAYLLQAKLYFPPAHLQPVFAALGHKEGDLPVTEELSRQILSLPIHSRLTDEDITYVAESLKEILAEG